MGVRGRPQDAPQERIPPFRAPRAITLPCRVPPQLLSTEDTRGELSVCCSAPLLGCAGVTAEAHRPNDAHLRAPHRQLVAWQAMSARGSSLAKLVKLGAAALQPTKADNGVWRKAAVSARSAARLRHAALLENRCVPRGLPRLGLLLCLRLGE